MILTCYSLPHKKQLQELKYQDEGSFDLTKHLRDREKRLQEEAKDEDKL